MIPRWVHIHDSKLCVRDPKMSIGDPKLSVRDPKLFLGIDPLKCTFTLGKNI